MKDSLEEVVNISIGAFSLIKDKFIKEVEDFIDQKNFSEEEKEKFKQKLLDKADEEKRRLRKIISQKVEDNLEKMGFVRSEKIEDLNEKIEKLEKKIKDLEKK